jgi:hypothetical protein
LSDIQHSDIGICAMNPHSAIRSLQYTPSRPVVTIAAVAAAIVTVAWRVLTFPGFNNDHYIYMAGGQQMVLGEWPVRDFVDPGWPLMYAASGAARALFGRNLGVELGLVSCAFAVGAAFTLAAASRLAGSVFAASVVTVLEVAINPRSFGYPKIALYAVAAWLFVSGAARMNVPRTIGLAVLTAVAFLFRHDHGLYIGVSALAAVLLGSWSGQPRSLLFRGGLFAAAVAMLLLPWAAFVQYQLGLRDYLRPALEFSRAEAEGTVIRTLPHFDRHALALEQTNLEVWLFYVFHSIPVIGIVLAVWRARHGTERWVGESAAVAAIGVMAIAFNLGVIRKPLYARLPDAVVPAAVIGAWLMTRAWQARTSVPRLAGVAASTIVLALTTWAVIVVADVRNELNTAGILNRRGALVERVEDLQRRLARPMPERDHIPSRNSEALMPFYAFVQRCTGRDDRLIMTGLSPDVFVLANRGFAGGQMAFRPSFYTFQPDQARALRRLRAQSVPFAIVALEEEPRFRSDMPLIASYVDAHYDRLAHIPVHGTRGLQLYVERGRRAAARDRATGWPCFGNAPGLRR